jgi:hypothetical protein
MYWRQAGLRSRYGAVMHNPAVGSITACAHMQPPNATCGSGVTDTAVRHLDNDSNIHRHMLLSALQSWSLSWSSPRPGRSRSSGGGANGFDTASNALSLTERQVNLKQQRASSFVDLCLAPSGVGQPVGSVGVYALTDKGNLLLLRPTGRTVDRSINLQVGSIELSLRCAHTLDAAQQQLTAAWLRQATSLCRSSGAIPNCAHVCVKDACGCLQLQVREAFGLAATSKLVACACAQGVVRLFSSKSLAFRANLPYWTAAGMLRQLML